MPRSGRLDIEPLVDTTFSSAARCAQACLDLSPEQCLSFNYDFDESMSCQLLGDIEGPDTSLHEVNYSLTINVYGKCGTVYNTKF